ncbi:MAG TPA: hypothetical protein PKN70_16055 [Smithellaceae bacterium]|nr:hypothetical protein [Smithellaceae bacterium]
MVNVTLEYLQELQRAGGQELSGYSQKTQKLPADMLELSLQSLNAQQLYWLGVLSYFNEFSTPFWIALNSFLSREKEKIQKVHFLETINDYVELLKFNMQILEKGLTPSIAGAHDFHREQTEKFMAAFFKFLFDVDGDNIKHVSKNSVKTLDNLIRAFPRAVQDVKKDFGFHFDDGGYEKIAETDRFTLYQVFSRDKSVKVRKKAKPVIIVHPYVLGANILGFLPDEKKSYTHAFADQGIPTYIRILKNIHQNHALQVMTGEDDARDTRYFCEIIKDKHNKPLILNGFCQGGFICVCDLLSGELDDVVDALITCVAPIDGTRSKALVEYLQHLPPRFIDLSYAAKKTPAGHQVVDGKVMSWVYKLKSMDKEAPLVTFSRDLASVQSMSKGGADLKVNKTAAALLHWLTYDRLDLPMAITQMSFDSYTIPITKDGTLPVSLFGKELNFRKMKENNIKWLICYGEADDLVDKDTTLAALDYVDAEVTPFPKGHGAIATTWSNPDSEYALHKTYPNGCRGPVRYQLDLEKEG